MKHLVVWGKEDKLFMNYRLLGSKVMEYLFLDKQVSDFYHIFQEQHPNYTPEHILRSLIYIYKLNKAQYKRCALSHISLPKYADKYYCGSPINPDLDYYKNQNNRYTAKELCDLLENYDVVSFDIFDTALLRKVENPNDVFTLMAIEMGFNDFVNIRKKAENLAREQKERETGSREIVISDIYEVLSDLYNIDLKWENREIELEEELSIPNPYILNVYNYLVNIGKTVIFTSDMYLPKGILARMLHKNGYNSYANIYVSNEYGKNKGMGDLQKIVLSEFHGQKIVHIGDNEISDIKKTEEAGIDAIFNPDCRLKYREPDMDNIAGSFYRAIINNTLNNGTWNDNIYFDHGFRVGGILVVGFCKYINEVAKSKGIEKILFCARDCEIIWKIYNQHFKEYDNSYIEISRYSIMNITSDRYLYDLANRTILRYAENNKSTKTITMVLKETGYEYLIDYLDDNDIEKFCFPLSIDKKKLEKFIFDHRKLIFAYNKTSVESAIKYFGEQIQGANKLLIVDIGWSGTCISCLKYFIETHIPNQQYQISGVLMCSSRGQALTTSISSGDLVSYVYSPFENLDQARFMMPPQKTIKEQDLLHMPLEYLFTSTEKSLARYMTDGEGNNVFERTQYSPYNIDEIKSMQEGMLAFAERFVDYTKEYSNYFYVSPYVAFNPLKYAIQHKEYIYAVYKNFHYDACVAPYAVHNSSSKFGELFNIVESKKISSKDKKKNILFITPELIYTGAPRSMLRMCRVAIDLGYNPIVWSAKPGPFATEFEKINIDILIVPEKDLPKREHINLIKSCDMAICNTIVTDRYARICSYFIPTVWYIREATNIPDFCRNNPERLFTLKHSRDICCVSEYASNAISIYTKHKIRVVHNSVEDETNMAIPHTNGSAEKIRFVQFGTLEYRKGYDVLLAAYKGMPAEYRKKSELFFAGGSINSSASYCSYLFGQINNDDNIHYLGEIKGESKKIETLSQMDVVVVASRDESCSLVALEGAMLSKPLIVTENVGAKYIVHDDNGLIVKTADVDSLKKALMDMIDKRLQLENMGKSSRNHYEKQASMTVYTNNMEELFLLSENKNKISFRFKAFANRFYNNHIYRDFSNKISETISALKRKSKEEVIVTLTSHPGRIKMVHRCISSLLNQKSKPKKVLLWLSTIQFQNKENDLPGELLSLLSNSLFEIRWVDDDLAPHKKYFYAAQEFSDLPIIIVDDDVEYDDALIEKLMASYRKHPDCVSCMRANMLMFRSDGTLRNYAGWLMGYTILLDTPTYQLMPTGVGGVLYPPNSIPQEAFNEKAIKQTCLYCDDLWLKIWTSHNNYKTVVPRDYCVYKEITGTQQVALWKTNVTQQNNDKSLYNILKYYEANITNKDELLKKIWKDRYC